MELRVIIGERGDGLLEAQMLELDIGATGRSEQELVEELQHAILMEYRIARKHGLTPFVKLTTVPQEFLDAWDEDASSPMGSGSLNLPEEVVVAIALVLHAPRPRFTIREYYKKAA